MFRLFGKIPDLVEPVFDHSAEIIVIEDLAAAS